MTKTVKILLCIVLLLVFLIAGMVLFAVLQKDPSPDTQAQEPTQTVSTTAQTEEPIPETTAVETEPVEISVPDEKKVSKIVSLHSEDSFTEESFFYDYGGNIVRHFIAGYQNGEQTYSIDIRYHYDNNGLLTQIKEVNQSIAQQEFHYEQGLLTGYTYHEIMADEIAYSVTYHYERDEYGNVIRITTTGSEADIWTIGEYGYDEQGRCIYAYEQERYGDHDFERRMTYDHSFTGVVIAETAETLFGTETTTRRILFGNPEHGYLYGPELRDGYTMDSDANGCITAVRDTNGQTVASFEYVTIPAESEEASGVEAIAPADIADIPAEFTFSSGAGAWATQLMLESDGSFTGAYHDSDMGDQGENYPNGTVYFCNFEGRFKDLEQVTDYIYTMRLDYVTTEEPAGNTYYEDGVRYIASGPQGMTNADEFYLYLPGTSLTDLPDAFLLYSHIDDSIRDTLPSGYWGIYNVGGEAGFISVQEDSIWYREYSYVQQERRASLHPSYYGMSSLIFWPESGAAAMILEFPWSMDGQTEFNACDYHGGTGGYHVSLQFNEDCSAVTVSVTSLHGVDLSPWGGTTDGTFTAEFVDE